MTQALVIRVYPLYWGPLPSCKLRNSSQEMQKISQTSFYTGLLVPIYKRFNILRADTLPLLPYGITHLLRAV
jgi:hypothetical protein